MSSNSLNQAVVAATDPSAITSSSLSQASSQNELVEENQRLQQQLQTQSAEVARSHEELYLCKKKIEQLTNSQFADAEETPREVDLFADENMEEIFETIETLRLRVEQLQVNCEKLAQEKAAVEQKIIDREKQFQATSSSLQEEINFLRKTNLQLLSSQENSNGSNTEDVPAWVKEALDAECLRTELQNAQKEVCLGPYPDETVNQLNGKIQCEQDIVESLQVTILEKDKYIANLEWQLVDSDATIATLQAERDRLTMEIDCSVVPDHLSSVQGSLEALGAAAEPPIEDQYEYYIDDHSFDATEGFRRRVRKPARRHLSDLTRRDFSEIEDVRTFCQKTSIRSLSDVDVPRHVISAENLSLGTLKRSTNFSNINALDESEKFKLDDSVDLMTGSLASGSLCDDSSMENVANMDVGKGLAKGKWQSFGSDSEIGKLNGRDLQHFPPPLPNKTDNDVNAWGSRDDILQGGEGGAEAQERRTFSGDWQDADALASKSDNVKNDSCRSSSSAYCSADEGNCCTSPDLWGEFTPDSIIDVSTGKVIDVNGEVENSDVNATPEQHTNGECSTDLDSCGGNKKTVAGDLLDGCTSSSTVRTSFERSTSVRSEGTAVISTCHSKQNSEPASLERSASVNDGYRRSKKAPTEVLEEYQKWKVTGRKGEPPAKLKISQC